MLSILLTGISIAQTINLSGTVIRHSGEPVAGITVTCTNADPIVSDENGNFIFSNLPAGEPYLINGEFMSTDIYDGITILDFLFASNSMLGLNEYISLAQPFAGDLNNSGSLSTFDLIKYRFAVVRKSNFETSPNWLFFDANAFTPNSGIYINNETTDVEGLELVAVKRGDIALEADHIPAPVNAPEPIYYFQNQQISAGETFEVDIQVDNFQSIAGFQHGLKWDESLIDFVSFEYAEGVGGDYNDELTEQGDFLMYGGHYVGDFDQYLYLEDGAKIYNLTFQANQDIEDIAMIINFSDAIIPFQTVFATDQDILYLLSDEYQEGIVTSTAALNNLETFTINPNLTQEYSDIQISFSTPQYGELQLLDINGRLLESWTVEGIEFQGSISFSNLPNGTYALQLRTKEGVKTKRIVKQ